MPSTLDQKKADYNYFLSVARSAAKRAAEIRKEIVAERPELRGKSTARLERAFEDLHVARTFAGAGDVAGTANPFRNGMMTPRYPIN